MKVKKHQRSESIAIVGMAGRFPGAENIAEFWQKLCNGDELITQISRQTAISAGADQSFVHSKDFVGAAGLIDNYEDFDSKFFNFSDRDALSIDPQHRVFLECAWEALEDAGCDPLRFDGAIGVFAGAGAADVSGPLDCEHNKSESLAMQRAISTRVDHLCTRVAYKLDLTGPAVSIGTACSTSLVAVSTAIDSLRARSCDLALAGGVRIRSDLSTGYRHEEGMIYSGTGRCRPFDHRADGTVPGNGVGIVVLRRLGDAISCRDNIYAVIRGRGINNDGSNRVGYQAPGIIGQSRAISMALDDAGLKPSDIFYVEGHGTGTALGDLVELEALHHAFKSNSTTSDRCFVGSIKSNVGHLEAASGVAGLIKVALALRHRKLPPTINFEKPNPNLNLECTPFRVAIESKTWKRSQTARRAGISSFGIGGTNVHLVLEEPPHMKVSRSSRTLELLTLSAKDENALARMTLRLADFLEAKPDSLADAARTLQIGRRHFRHRRCICMGAPDSAAAMRTADQYYDISRENPIVTFFFPGMGTQFTGMAKRFYDSEPVYRLALENSISLLEKPFGDTLKNLVLGDKSADSALMQKTQYAQTGLFVTEYALAKFWMHLGVRPGLMVGHSIGEYVAACVAGVISLEDAVKLVVTRSQLIQSLPTGGMLAIWLSEEDCRALIKDYQVALASINGSKLCVMAGCHENLLELNRFLVSRNVRTKILDVEHAFHSNQFEQIIDRFSSVLENISFHEPEIPYVSNLDGEMISSHPVQTPEYWTKHLVSTVQFSKCMRVAFETSDVILEIGPSGSLPAGPSSTGRSIPVCASQPHRDASVDNEAVWLRSLGQLWVLGVPVDWHAFGEDGIGRRISIPTYPFEASSSLMGIQDLTRNADTRMPDALSKSSRSSRQNDELIEELHAEILAIWRDLFGTQNIALDDNFFNLGGDSLLVIRLVSLVSNRFELTVSPQDVYENPSFAGFLNCVEQVLLSSGPEEATSVKRVDLANLSIDDDI